MCYGVLHYFMVQLYFILNILHIVGMSPTTKYLQVTIYDRFKKTKTKTIQMH